MLFRWLGVARAWPIQPTTKSSPSARAAPRGGSDRLSTAVGTIWDVSSVAAKPLGEIGVCRPRPSPPRRAMFRQVNLPAGGPSQMASSTSRTIGPLSRGFVGQKARGPTRVEARSRRRSGQVSTRLGNRLAIFMPDKTALQRLTDDPMGGSRKEEGPRTCGSAKACAPRTMIPSADNGAICWRTRKRAEGGLRSSGKRDDAKQA